ncbi:Mrp/NBP35 family ATP-binding protein [Aestuariirhabdus litorea]|uniref:Iron-sulfur cluster carrier protein n=1 Tax=Aestuariirhabdus litorea TaxID=2528527 RepID=A0A3P3VKI1_9GAMM|nr:Mrp/NBP35 family ATP-binding protein [Aestuariirhabdus litorea]RRJ82817.1 ATP-binding protein [Aestuariirhabdus litorea]RWW92976.1 ATP-binding protein [Endozoicomonadaceae bacterium GTF-13]
MSMNAQHGYSALEQQALEQLAAMALSPSGDSLLAGRQVYDVVETDGVLRVFIDTERTSEPEQEMLAEVLAPALKAIQGVQRVIVKPRPMSVSNGKRISGVSRVVAVHSGKGGVGKSTLTAELALLLARQGMRVGVLDADIYGPSAPILFGTHGAIHETAGKMTPLEAHGVKLMSLGFLLPDDQALIWRGSLVDSGLPQFFSDVAWGELDILLVDLPPGTSDVHLAALQACEFDGVITITAPGQVSLDDVRRGMEMFADLAVPCLGLVENQSSVLCVHCGTLSPLFGSEGGGLLAEKIGLPLLARLPFDPALAEAADEGQLAEVLRDDHPLVTALQPLLERLKGLLQRKAQTNAEVLQ